MISPANKTLLIISTTLALLLASLLLEVFWVFLVLIISAVIVLPRQLHFRTMRKFALKGQTATATIIKTEPVFQGKFICNYTITVSIVLQNSSSYETSFYKQFKTKFKENYSVGRQFAVRIHPDNRNQVIPLCSLQFETPQQEEAIEETIRIAEYNTFLPYTGNRFKGHMKSATARNIETNEFELWDFSFELKKSKNIVRFADSIKKSAKNSYFNKYNGEPFMMEGEDGDIPVSYRLLKDKNTDRYILHKRKNGKRKLGYGLMILVLSVTFGWIPVPIIVGLIDRGLQGSELSNMAYISSPDGTSKIWELRLNRVEEGEENSTSFSHYNVFVKVYEAESGKKLKRHTIRVDKEISTDFQISCDSQFVYFFSFKTNNLNGIYDTSFYVLAFDIKSFEPLDFSGSPISKTSLVFTLKTQFDRNAAITLEKNKRLFSLELTNENTGILYKVYLDEPSKFISNQYFYYGENCFENIEHLILSDRLSMGCSYKKVIPEKILINPIFIYQDIDMAIIQHNDKLGTDKTICFTCVKWQGEGWTISLEDFPGTKQNKKNVAESNNPHDLKAAVYRENENLIFKMEPLGFMSVDRNNGNINWTFTAK